MSTSATDLSRPLRTTHSRRSSSDEIDTSQIETKADHNRPRYHKQGLILIALRPLNAPSYFYQHGFKDTDIDRTNHWMTVIKVLNSITGLITIPLLSALIAQAVAVHSQKHLSLGDLQLKHLVTLADRGWTNPLSVSNSIGWRGRGSKTSRNLLLFAAIVPILGSIQQPLYQILAPIESILVPICKDTEYMRYALKNYDINQCKKGTPARAVGWDLEPSTMRDTSYEDMVQKLMRDLADVSVSDVLPNLWANEPNALADKKTIGNVSNGYFIASLDQATTTGVLREHIMRLNSSVSCNRLDRSQYPSTCPGKRPFTRDFLHDNNRTRICVPGELGPSPWTISRNRQELSEQLYIDILEELVFSPNSVDERNWTTDVTLHCTANTTRGYFELGNYRNNNTWGPLLEHWPSPSLIETEFNDYMSDYRTEYPSESDDRGVTVVGNTTIWPSSWRTHGPLTMAAVSLFGNKTFFDLGTLAWNGTFSDTELSLLSYNKICSLEPFSRLIPLRVGEGSELGPKRDEKFPACSMSSVDESDGRTLRAHLSAWLHGFNKTDQATTAISAAVHLANKASLTLDKWQDRYNPGRALHAAGGRTIYTASGITVNKPGLSIAAMSVLSALLFLELVNLAILAWLIYQEPSESRSLDVLTFVRLKDCIDDRIKQ